MIGRARARRGRLQSCSLIVSVLSSLPRRLFAMFFFALDMCRCT